MKLFDPSAQPRLIKPLRSYRPRNKIFAKKELSIRVMNALREAGEGGATKHARQPIVMRVERVPHADL